MSRTQGWTRTLATCSTTGCWPSTPSIPERFLLSTHLIDEAADVLERVVMIDHGRIVLDAATDDVRGAATTVSGPAAVQAFVAGRPTWDRRRLASRESVVIGETLDAGDRARARELHLDLGPLSLQQVIVHAAGQATEDLKERTCA
jgi:ABC-2 type transport system ATP-binding protein